MTDNYRCRTGAEGSLLTGNPASIDSIGLVPVIPSKHLQPSLVSNLVSVSTLFGDINTIDRIALMAAVN